MKEVFGTEPELIAQGRGIFDVAINGELVYSKFKTGSFPDEEQLIAELLSTYSPP